jgi:hypothetical protein
VTVRGQLIGTVVVLAAASSPVAAGADWYLLQPPYQGTQSSGTKAPLSAWHRVGAFDSAENCAAERLRKVESVEAAYRALLEAPTPHRELTMVTSRSMHDFLLSLMEALECIASDDERLAK